MGYMHPFMQRRGDRFYFRIQVPAALRDFVGQREFTKALKTGDRSKALPWALELGSIAKHLFDELQQPTMSKAEMMQLLAAARAKLRIDELRNLHEHEVAASMSTASSSYPKSGNKLGLRPKLKPWKLLWRALSDRGI
jgi:hypothetical protein